jgi:hypothetical protein
VQVIDKDFDLGIQSRTKGEEQNKRESSSQSRSG